MHHYFVIYLLLYHTHLSDEIMRMILTPGIWLFCHFVMLSCCLIKNTSYMYLILLAIRRIIVACQWIIQEQQCCITAWLRQSFRYRDRRARRYMKNSTRVCCITMITAWLRQSDQYLDKDARLLYKPTNNNRAMLHYSLTKALFPIPWIHVQDDTWRIVHM